MVKISPVNFSSVNQNYTGEKKSKKQFYLKMDQKALIGTGGLSLLAGIVRFVDSFEAGKKSVKKLNEPLAWAIFDGVLAAGLIASMFGVFHIKYGEKKQ